MKIVWGAFWQKSRKWLKIGWLITAGLLAVYVGVIGPANDRRGIASSKATGLAAIEESRNGRLPYRLFAHNRQARVETVTFLESANADKVAPMEQAAAFGISAFSAPPPPQSPVNSDDRKMIRSGTMDLVVKKPSEAAEKIRQLAERMGGFLVSSQTNGDQDAAFATLTIRVPVARFEEVRAEIRKLGLRVDSERLEAQDVTRQYVDQAARLHNLRAQEVQYLAILKQAHTVKDTLEVSEKLNEVRGEIEQQQAEFDALSKQVETVAITVSLRAEADAQVFGLHWRPLFQLKLAAREGLDGIADYTVVMTSFLFYLPAILLWLATILMGAAVGWRILRWAGRLLFAKSRTTSVNV